MEPPSYDSLLQMLERTFADPESRRRMVEDSLRQGSLFNETHLNPTHYTHTYEPTVTWERKANYTTGHDDQAAIDLSPDEYQWQERASSSPPALPPGTE